MPFDRNLLLYGDNLGFLADPEIFPSESVDLVYLDPPFKSDATYNVLFKEVGGEASAAQIKAFDDTWSWDQSAAESLARLMADPHASAEVQALVKTLHGFLGHSPMLAYLVQMAVRLVHLRRVLKPTGSLYLHCDPTASHYLKLVLDGIFGPENFRSEIVWQRTNSRSTAGNWPGVHDTILYYKHDGEPRFLSQKAKGSQHKIPHTLITWRDGEKYQTYELTAPGVTAKGESGKPWRGFDPAKFGRHWANSQAVMDEWDAQDLIHWPKNGGFPRARDPNPFSATDREVTVGDVWTDIDRINQAAKERLGYPTQKPIALLRRIISASSNPGDVILDPFCGCGTTIDAVETLNREHPDRPARRWVGIDITHLAINLIKSRLTRFDPAAVYEVRGEPTDLSGARALFEQDPYQFQFWACGLVGARPRGSGGGKGGKKGADQGIDGSRFFVDDNKGPKSILVQVKGGKTGAKDIRDFRGVIEREGAALGIFITMQDSTKAMREEAASLPPYQTDRASAPVPRLQIVTIEQLLSGGTPRQPAGVILPRGVDSAASDKTFKKAKRHEAPSLFMKGDG